MEKFLSLPPEKQKKVIDSAFFVFGDLGYRKASAKDIAVAAGISKGMIFHYFGSKKALYLYLVDFARNIVLSGVQNHFDENNTDFFDRILMAARIKTEALSIPDLYPF